MNWTSPASIKAQVNKWWDSGELLAELVDGAKTFPRIIKVKQPSAKEMSDSFDEVRSWAAQFQKVSNCSIEWREVNHRILGRNKLPEYVTIATADDAYAIIGKQRETKKFKRIVEITKEQVPELLSWLRRRPHRALELFERWEQMLSIVSWIRKHPRPEIYLRQVDIPGIHTKLIEEHRTVLSELLDLVLLPEQIDLSASGKSQFAKRYGFLDKPLRIRFRILDPGCALIDNVDGKQDITMDGDSFSKLCAPVTNVFFTENEVNYLAFPEVKNSMVIFGSGYGAFDVLANVSWLFQCRIFYWGDLDTHGFNILNSIRKILPHTRSFLMDEETLLAHTQFWVAEETQFAGIDLLHLTEQEHEIYTKLKNQYWGKNLRLEQEMIAWHLVESAIAKSVLPRERFATLLSDDAKMSTSSTPILFTYSDILDLLKPSRCELRVFLKNTTRVDEEETHYERVIRELAKRYERNHKDSFSQIDDFSEMDTHTREVESKKAIDEKSEVIYKPLLMVPAILNGTIVKIRGEPDFLIYESESYFVRNVKFARRIVESQHPEVFMEAQLHGWLLTQIVGKPPSRLEVLAGDGQIYTIAYDGGLSVLRCLAEIMSIRCQPEEPYSPVGLSKCHGCAFQKFCWERAEHGQDVAILPGVGQELARTLRRLDARNIETLTKEFDEEKLSMLQIRESGKTQRVGERATKILLGAAAHLRRHHIVFKKPTLPVASNYVVMDFEGMPPQFDDMEFVYLWGLQVFGEQPSEYLSATADGGIKSDANTWFKFLDNANEIFNKYGDIPFIHWHHYERIKLERYIDTYGDPIEVGKRVQKNLVDILPVVQNSIALPLPSYSLKSVEKYIGFQRSQKQFGGEWAMAEYIENLHSENQSNPQSLNELRTYNQEDLRATWEVFKWLKSMA